MAEGKNEKTLGAVLREARLARKADLDEASKATKIHHRILDAMEKDDFTSLGTVYAKSFLKLYAEYLGLDKEGLAQRLPAYSGRQDSAALKKMKPASDSQSASRRPPFVPFSPGAPRRPKRVPVPAVVAAAVVFLVVLLWTRWAVLRPSAPDKKQKRVAVPKQGPAVRPAQASFVKKAQEARPPAEKKASPVSSPVVAKTQTSRTSLPPAQASSSGMSAKEPREAKLMLIVRAKNKTWLQVKSDGKVVFQAILPKGAAESWQAGEKIELWVGDAGNLELEFNGRLLGKIGRPGQIIRHAVLTRSGLSIQR